MYTHLYTTGYSIVKSQLPLGPSTTEPTTIVDSGAHLKGAQGKSLSSVAVYIRRTLGEGRKSSKRSRQTDT